MKLYSLFLIKFIFFFLFTSCAYFDEEEDKILPGKRERVFISDDKILKKANKRVKFYLLKLQILGNSNIKMLETIYITLKSTII